MNFFIQAALVPLVMLGLMQIAHADGADTACTFVGGCGPENALMTFGPIIGNMLVYTIAGLSVLFVIWGGAQMLLSLGDDAKITKGRQSIMFALIGFGTALASQTIVAFVVVQSNADATGSGGNPLIASLNVAINSMFYLFNITFAIIMIIAGYKLVVGYGQSEVFASTRKMLLYAAVGAVIVNLAKSLSSAVLNLGL